MQTSIELEQQLSTSKEDTLMTIPMTMTSVNKLPNNGSGIGTGNGRADDPFDLEKLRLSQDFGSMIGVKKALLTVPVRKPHRQEFIRVHPSPEYRFDTAVIELKDERGETYLIDPALRDDLPGEVVPKTLLTTMNKQGVLFLWPVKLPGSDGKVDNWNQSAVQIAEMAMTKWVRVVANMSLGAYEAFIATGNLAEPEWPEQSFKALLTISFKDRFIRSLDHPILRQLRGEV